MPSRRRAGDGLAGFDDPFSSRSISGGSHPVQGLAPMREKTAGVSTVPPFVGFGVLQLDGFEEGAAHHFSNLRMRKNFNVGPGLDAAREVARQLLARPSPRMTSRTAAPRLGQKHRGLPRELPPPATITVEPWQSCPSRAVAA